MNREIKQRIDQIKNGEVPQGYKKTKIGIVPNDWEICKAKNVFKNVSDKNHKGELEVLSVTQDRGVIPRSHVDIDIKYDLSNVVNYKKVERGDFVISLRSFQGGIEYSDYTGLVSPAYTVLKNIRDIKSVYYKTYFKSDNYIKQLNVAVYGIRDGKQISYDDFGFIEILYPPLNEQQKISDILSIQDKVIELKEKLLKEKEKQKKYLMQNLLTVRKRLKGFNGEWKKVKLKEYLMEISERNKGLKINNVLSVNNKLGFVKQEIQFGKTVASKDLSNYKIIKNNFIAYNPSRINVGSIAIYQGEVQGIVSPMYVVFKTNEMLDSNYFMFFVQSYEFFEKMKSLLSGSVRDSLNFSDLCNMQILLPSLEEQKAIAEILTTADKELKLLQEELEEEKRKKKALMQLLLTGIVRVKV